MFNLPTAKGGTLLYTLSHEVLFNATVDVGSLLTKWDHSVSNARNRVALHLSPYPLNMPHFHRRFFAILVNFNVDPNALYEETVFIRRKLLKAVEETKFIGQRARLDAAHETQEDMPSQLYRLKHEVLSKRKLDRAFLNYERLEQRLMLPKHVPKVERCSYSLPSHLRSF